MLIARIVCGIYIMERERSTTAHLNRSRPFSPREVMDLAWHPDEPAGVNDFAACRVKLVPQAGSQLSAQDRDVFIGRMPMRWNLIAVRHLKPHRIDRTVLERITGEYR